MRKTRKIIIFSALIIFLILSIILFYHFKVKTFLIKPQGYLLKHFSFSSKNDLNGWVEKVLKGRVEYNVENFGNNACIHARSDDNASALYYKIKVDMEKHPILSWKWNVIKFPQKTASESLTDREEDDYGARMYVIFISSFLGGMKSLEYIWAEQLPKDTISSSPYTSNIKLFVLESSYSKEGELVCEKRDIYEDYVKAFGKEPTSDIGSIAFMTDSDSTSSCAEAVYGEITIEYKKQGGEQ